MVLTKDLKLGLLEKVLNSKAFSKSTTSNTLLRYLVESSINGELVNATTTAMEVFGSQYVPEKSDAAIRVNIYHLRKKLDAYYENEGANNKWRISIEKGQYSVLFEENLSPIPEVVQQPKPFLSRQEWMGICTIFFMIVLLVIYLFLQRPNTVWRQFVINKKPNTVFVGDVFGYKGPTISGNQGWHRDYQINSTEDFQQAIDSNPTLKETYRPANYSYLIFMNVFIIKELTRFFIYNNSDFNVRKVSEVTFQDIKEQNVLYAGPLKNNNKFIEVFNENARHFEFSFSERIKQVNHLYQLDSAKNILKAYDLAKGGEESEYAIVAKFIGIDNNAQLLFFSDHGLGVTATIEYFTNTDSLNNFSDQYLTASDEFIAIFQVEGKERTPGKLTLLYVDNNL